MSTSPVAPTVVKVPQQAWFSDTELALEFPSSWNIQVHRMQGYDLPAMSPEGIRRALASPIGTPTIRDLALGKSEVAIIVDDISRPTKLDILIPYVLEELASAGVSDEHIRFVIALGSHGAHTRVEVAKKLGKDIPGRFPVYNHNPYEHCTYVGTTSNGTRVEVNAEVMRCDLKIGMGAVLPHPSTGWGGGAKILLPGVSSMDTIVSNHNVYNDRFASNQPEIMPVVGRHAGNHMRLDMEEAAKLAGLDVVVDALVNQRRDTVDLLVGDPAAVVKEGARRGRSIYATKPVDESYDIIVANSYSKSNEASIAARRVPTWGSKLMDLVVVTNVPEGQVVHYLGGTWGGGIGGRLWRQLPGLPVGIGRVMIYSEYPEKSTSHYFGNPALIEWYQSWSKVMAELQATHPQGAKVAVFPDLTIQYFPELAEAAK